VPAVYFFTTNGCPGNCDFCTNPQLRHHFWHMDLEEIDRHLNHLRQIGVKTLILMDDQFLGGLLLHSRMGGIEKQLQRIRDIMGLVNRYFENIEFANGLQLNLLNKYWDEIAEPLFKRCFRLYVPLERLSRTERLSKLPSLDETMDLLRKLAALPARGTSKLRQITFGLVLGSPEDKEEDLKLTVERCEDVKQVFKESSIEIALTPFCCNIVQGTKLFDTYNWLNLPEVEKHPEVWVYSLASNHALSIKVGTVWRYYLEILKLNPAPLFLENFRKTGEVKLAKV
jgi:radical SAM superfamily enzyme YgiQ (UPF0313 family)